MPTQAFPKSDGSAAQPSPAQNPIWQDSVWRVCGDNPRLMASCLLRFAKAQSHGLTGLAAWLGIDCAGLTLLALCQRPAPDHFAEHLGILSRRVGGNPQRLAELLRTVETLESWTAQSPALQTGDRPASPSAIGPLTPPVSASPGWLMAASQAPHPSPPGDALDTAASATPPPTACPAPLPKATDPEPPR